VELLAPFLVQLEADARIGQGVAGDQLGDVAALGALGLEELEAGGRVEEQVLDLDDRADRGTGGALGAQFAAFDEHFGADLLLVKARDQAGAADGGDAGQRLTAKAQRSDGIEIIHRAQLAG